MRIGRDLPGIHVGRNSALLLGVSGTAYLFTFTRDDSGGMRNFEVKVINQDQFRYLKCRHYMCDGDKYMLLGEDKAFYIYDLAAKSEKLSRFCPGMGGIVDFDIVTEHNAKYASNIFILRRNDILQGDLSKESVHPESIYEFSRTSGIQIVANSIRRGEELKHRHRIALVLVENESETFSKELCQHSQLLFKGTHFWRLKHGGIYRDADSIIEGGGWFVVNRKKETLPPILHEPTTGKNELMERSKRLDYAGFTCQFHQDRGSQRQYRGWIHNINKSFCLEFVGINRRYFVEKMGTVVRVNKGYKGFGIIGADGWPRIMFLPEQQQVTPQDIISRFGFHTLQIPCQINLLFPEKSMVGKRLREYQDNVRDNHMRTDDLQDMIMEPGDFTDHLQDQRFTTVLSRNKRALTGTKTFFNM